MQTAANTFHCRGCNSVVYGNSHSQKRCIDSKKQAQQAKEDLEFERNKFISKYNLKRKSTSPLPKNETIITTEDSQTKSTPDKRVKFDLTTYERPQTLRKRKVAPVQQWYGPPHNHQAKK